LAENPAGENLSEGCLKKKENIFCKKYLLRKFVGGDIS
jgi:hypothetical protein